MMNGYKIYLLLYGVLRTYLYSCIHDTVRTDPHLHASPIIIHLIVIFILIYTYIYLYLRIQYNSSLAIHDQGGMEA